MIEKLYFDKIKEDRGDYFVEYHPPLSPNRLATLYLTFPKAVEPEKVAEIIEKESEAWIRRYPVAVFSSAFDDADNQIEVSKYRDSSNLVTWLEKGSSNIRRSWNVSEQDEHLDSMPLPDWKNVYHNVKYKTASDVSANALEYAKQKRKQNLFLKIIFILWLAVLPAVWAIIEYLGPDWLARLVLIFVLVKTTIAGLRASGYIKPSAKMRKDAEEERLKNHHHYHCKINPSGFARLKAENFDNEARSKTLEDANKLKSK